MDFGYWCKGYRWARSEVDDDQAVVVGVEREEAGGGGAVHRALQGGDGVAAQGDVDDFLVEDDGRGGVDGIDGDVHILLVGVQEDVAAYPCKAVAAGDGLDAVDEAAVDRGVACEGVEALAASGVGDAHRVDGGGLRVGGEELQFVVDTVERGADIHRAGAGDADRLCGHEGLAHLVGCVRGLGHAVEREWLFAAVGEDFHGVAIHGQGEVELTEDGVGGAVGTQLGGAVDEGSGAAVEGQCDRLDAAVSCQRLVLGRGRVACYHLEIAQRDMDGRHQDGGGVLPASRKGENDDGEQRQQLSHFAVALGLEIHVVVVEPGGFDGEVAAVAGREERAGELGLAVALKRDVGHHLVGDRGAVCVEHVDGDVHGLLVGGEEEVVDNTGHIAHCRLDDDGVGEACVGGCQAGGGAEALATGREGGAYALGNVGAGVGGVDFQPGDYAIECGADVHIIVGIGDVDCLCGGEGLAHGVVAKGGGRRAGEGDGGFVAAQAVAEHDHRVVAHRQGEVEMAEGGVGGGVGTQLGGLVLLGAVGGVEGQCDGFDAGVVGHILG